jgi:hypothetical protein
MALNSWRYLYGLSVLVILVLLTSCVQEISRIDLLNTKTGEVKVKLKKGEQVKFWADVDIEYVKEPEFSYYIEFFKEDTLVQQSILVEPFKSKVKKDEIKETKNDIVHYQFIGELDWHFIPKSSGVFTFKSSILQNKSPQFKMHKAHIFFVKKNFSKADFN